MSKQEHVFLCPTVGAFASSNLNLALTINAFVYSERDCRKVSYLVKKKLVSGGYFNFTSATQDTEDKPESFDVKNSRYERRVKPILAKYLKRVQLEVKFVGGESFYLQLTQCNGQTLTNLIVPFSQIILSPNQQSHSKTLQNHQHTQQRHAIRSQSLPQLGRHSPQFSNHQPYLNHAQFSNHQQYPHHHLPQQFHYQPQQYIQHSNGNGQQFPQQQYRTQTETQPQYWPQIQQHQQMHPMVYGMNVQQFPLHQQNYGTQPETQPQYWTQTQQNQQPHTPEHGHHHNQWHNHNQQIPPYAPQQHTTQGQNFQWQTYNQPVHNHQNDTQQDIQYLEDKTRELAVSETTVPAYQHHHDNRPPIDKQPQQTTQQDYAPHQQHHSSNGGNSNTGNENKIPPKLPPRPLDYSPSLVQDTGKIPEWIEYQCRVVGNNDWKKGRILLMEDEGISVISDIDDTIKHSFVCDKKLLLSASLIHQFHPVAGMKELYNRWKTEHSPLKFHYVSGSPYQIYEHLDEFLFGKDCNLDKQNSCDDNFPFGSVHLRNAHWKDFSIINLFKSPENFKLGIIEPCLFEAFPKRKWILVGDTSEKDPEIYSTLGRKYPHNVVAIFIRKAPTKLLSKVPNYSNLEHILFHSGETRRKLERSNQFASAPQKCCLGFSLPTCSTPQPQEVASAQRDLSYSTPPNLNSSSGASNILSDSLLEDIYDWQTKENIEQEHEKLEARLNALFFGFDKLNILVRTFESPEQLDDVSIADLLGSSTSS